MMNSRRPNFVILGSSGFTGAKILDELRECRGCSVRGFHSSDFDLRASDCAERLSHALDSQTVLIITARAGSGDVFDRFSSDVAIALNMAKAISIRPVEKCIYFSTVSVYGDAETDMHIDERTRISPTSPYGTAKFAAECLLRQVTQEQGIPLVILRPCKIYGPGDFSKAYGPVGFIESILEGKAVRIYGDGDELRDHVFIRDVVHVVVEMALGNQEGTFNLTSGESRSFSDILEIIRRIGRREFDVVRLKRSRPKVDQRFRPDRLIGALPGFGFTPLEEGIRETYECFFRRSEERILRCLKST